MHTIIKPPARVYYLATNGGELSGHGFVDPGQCLASGAQSFETFATQAELDARLANLGAIPQAMELTPDMAPSLAKILLCAKVNKIREEKRSLPFTFQGNTYDADPASVANVVGTVTGITARAILDPAFNLNARFTGWKTYANEWVALTARELIELGGALLRYNEACYIRADELKHAIDASADPAKDLTVKINAGWPTPSAP